MIKKLMNVGVGLMSSASGMMKGQVEELIERGKLTEKEGLELLKKVDENVKEKKQEFEGMLGTVTKAGLKVIKPSGAGKPTLKDVESMEARIQSLELKVTLLANEIAELSKSKTK